MKRLKLNNGEEIPTLGLGTYKAEPERVAEAVRYAIVECGYRHIDCASVYGNEQEIGKGIKAAISSGEVKREDLYITSKLWNSDHAPDDVEKACKRSLEDLGLEYLDLYLIHWAVPFINNGKKYPVDENSRIITAKVSTQETWRAMEALIKNKQTKSIGVSNFSGPQILDLLAYAETKPVINQIEVHPLFTQDDLIDYCNSQDIAVTAYSPILRADERIFKSDIIQRLSESKDATPSQIVLAWGIARGTIVIPKSVTNERIKENMGTIQVSLTEAEVKEISSLNQNLRAIDPGPGWKIPYFS